MLRWLTERRRRHLLEVSAPPAWREYVEQRTPSHDLLDAGERDQLFDLVRVFVAEKRWEACGGLVLTDEIQVTIAAMASVMLLGREEDLLDAVDTILVYPTAVKLPTVKRHRGPAIHAGATSGVRLPEGEIVLAWDAVLDDAAHRSDGANIVIHVLAHALDALDGREDGVPALVGSEARRAWSAALQPAFDAQRARLERGEPSFLRDQAADSPAEFFAVAAESMFERPAGLACELPAVYAALRGYFALDLAPRVAGASPYRG